MTVYVDNFNAPFDKMTMCHMIADSPRELHEFAAKIGLKRSWAQGSQEFPHYDVTLFKKAIAINFGAKSVSVEELASIRLKIKNGRRVCLKRSNFF